MMGRSSRGGAAAAVLASVGLIATLIGLVALFYRPSSHCLRLWDAADNASVRAAVSASGPRLAALNAHSVDGPGRFCSVTLIDHAGEPDGTFVIWPDNLFDNGALHEYMGPSDRVDGIWGIQLDLEPNVTVSDDGRLERN